MAYVALNTLKLGGKYYVRGEAIPSKTPKKDLKWLLERGAVQEIDFKPKAEAKEPEEVEEEIQEEDIQEEDLPVDENEIPEINVLDSVFGKKKGGRSE